jgi:hypothetical protein
LAILVGKEKEINTFKKREEEVVERTLFME